MVISRLYVLNLENILSFVSDYISKNLIKFKIPTEHTDQRLEPKRKKPVSEPGPFKILDPEPETKYEK